MSASRGPPTCPDTSRGAWRATLAATAAIVAAGLAGAAHFTAEFRAWTSDEVRRARVADAPVRLPPLEAYSATGSDVAMWGSGAKDAPVRLVTFMYTRCPTLCRVGGDEFFALQRELSETPEDGIRLLSLSFDPAHDTPGRLREYAARHRADPAWWTVAAPRNSEALAALLRAAGVVVIDDGLGGLAHNAAIHVVAGDGRLVRILDLADYRAALGVARRLALTGAMKEPGG